MTYSIVARDADTGEIGAAVQTYWFGAGSGVLWVESDLGAVATQSFVEVSYGPLGLQMMRNGKSPERALAALIAADENPQVRQVAMLGASGQVVAHTGDGCVEAAGHVTGDQVSCQANMMERDTVWPAMLAAYDAADGDLADKMMAALRAAENEGGDIRGRQSAAMMVAPAGEAPWIHSIDIHVDDSEAPLDELERLLHLSKAWDALGWAMEHAENGEIDKARELFDKALSGDPDDDQIEFWAATFEAAHGDRDEAKKLFARARAANPRWAPYLERIAARGLFDKELLPTLLSE